MREKQTTGDLNAEARERWNTNAEYWDEKYGAEGNLFHRVLTAPATERLLEIKPGELVLDVACGNGVVSRRLAQLGARVVAFDFSEAFLERAKARSADYADRIEFRVMDATDEEQLLSLGERRFDAAVCSMALMDMAETGPLFSALARLLKPEGRFVFSVLHPCFNTSGTHLLMEREDREGELVTEYGIKVLRYKSLSWARGLGIPGQPVAQVYFERTLSALLGAGFRAGFVLDGLEEPTFDENTSDERALTWANFKEIPPSMVARMRPKVSVQSGGAGA